MYKPATASAGMPSGLLHLGSSPLYAGPLGTVRWHAHAVPVLLLSLDHGFRLKTIGLPDWHDCEAAIVPAGLAHALETGDTPMLVWYPNPGLSNLSAMVRLLHNTNCMAGCIFGQSKERYFFRDLFERSDSQFEAGAIVDDFARTLLPAPVLDPRLQRVLNQLDETPDSVVSATEWATELGISASRFMHLFSDQAGVPFRTYRTWSRLRHSMRMASQGRSLTDAALASGFSDSQHFSREFSQKLGIAPSGFLRLVGRVGFN